MRLFQFILVVITLLFTRSTQADILGGPFTNSANGHVYYLLSTNTWTGAEAEAVSLGGHLATINDAAENHWVCTNFLTYLGAPRVLWIGFYQPTGSVEPTGGWIWASGESVTYTNWTPGEPNNNSNKGPQNWAMIWPPTAANVSPYSAEHWNDTWNLIDTGVGSGALYGMHGVVEIAPTALSGTPTNSVINNAVEIGWASQLGQYYRVQWSTEVAGTNWFDLGLPVRGNGSTNSVFDTTRAAGKRFYRVVPMP